jgi:ELWxxDGT repeat protein
LWVTDGSAVGTYQISYAFGPGASVSLGNGKALFSAHDSAHGNELWVTDGTAASTSMVADLRSGTGSSNPGRFAALGNGKALFVAVDDAHGLELWITDGSAPNTYLLKDINPGGGNSLPYDITAIGNGKALFSANDGTHGYELWYTDGTTGGTRLVEDINPGDKNSSPFVFTVLQAACYRRGTMILTPSGEVPVEALATGAAVVTLSGAGAPGPLDRAAPCGLRAASGARCGLARAHRGRGARVRPALARPPSVARPRAVLRGCADPRAPSAERRNDPPGEARRRRVLAPRAGATRRALRRRCLRRELSRHRQSRRARRCRRAFAGQIGKLQLSAATDQAVDLPLREAHRHRRAQPGNGGDIVKLAHHAAEPKPMLGAPVRQVDHLHHALRLASFLLQPRIERQAGEIAMLAWQREAHQHLVADEPDAARKSGAPGDGIEPPGREFDLGQLARSGIPDIQPPAVQTG